MDAFSSSVSSTLKVSATLHPSLSSSRNLLHFKNPNLPPQPQPNFSKPTRPSSISSSRRTSFTLSHAANFSSTSFSSAATSSRRSSPPPAHRRPATGYAAALLDIAQCNSSLESVEKDVRRFWRLLGNKQIRAILEDPATGEKEKGRVVKEVAEKGRFDKNLVGLVRMMVEKNKVGMVGEVLEEFERIYDELSGTSVVLVSSPVKMEKEQLFGIARRRRVQRLCGAVKVKDKVKNLVGDDDQRSLLTPHFA